MSDHVQHGVIISATPPDGLRDKGMRRMLASAPSQHLDGEMLMKRFVLIFGDDLAKAFVKQGLAQPPASLQHKENPHV